MKKYWDWDTEYFENYIFRHVKPPQEFTVMEFMESFNNLPKGFSFSTIHFGWEHRLISDFLHKMIGRVLTARYVSDGTKTVTIFQIKNNESK